MLFLRTEKGIVHEYFFDNIEAFYVIFDLIFEFLNPKIVHLGTKIIKIDQEMSILGFLFLKQCLQSGTGSDNQHFDDFYFKRWIFIKGY